MRIGFLGLLYIVVGIIVAAMNDYFDSVGTARRLGEALLAVLLWPLVLFGVDINLEQRFRAAVPFRYALFLEDGELADPAVVVTATPTRHEGDLFLPRGGERFRIVAIEPAIEDDAPFHAAWTVEPFPG